MNATSGLGVIENAGPNHLRGFLKSHLGSTRQADIAVAFITVAGLSELLPALKKASMNGPVRLLTGLYQCFTEPAALQLLLTEQTDTKGRLSVRLSTDPHFHWKAYFLAKRGKATAIVGSSNLTAEGLGGSGEFNAVFSVETDSSAYRAIHKPFDEEWARAKPLHEEHIARYAKARPKMARALQPTMSVEEILGGNRRVKSAPNTERQYWRDSISGYAAAATEKIISDSTNWDDRGYAWYGSREPRHQRDDRILLFDFAEGWVHLVRVTAVTRTPERTPDGQYFSAYQRLKNTHRRKLGRSLWQALKASQFGLSKRDMQTAKKLTPAVFEKLRKTLGC